MKQRRIKNPTITPEQIAYIIKHKDTLKQVQIAKDIRCGLSKMRDNCHLLGIDFNFPYKTKEVKPNSSGMFCEVEYKKTLIY